MSSAALPAPSAPSVPSAVQKRYQDALRSLAAQLEADRYVLAVILCGSLSYDEVWDKSDIDLLVVTTEDLKAGKNLSLLADGITVHAYLQARSKFKATLQSATQSSFFHSLLSKSTLLFSRDPTVSDWYDGCAKLGERDRQIQTLRLATGLLPTLTKAEKWFYVKRDFGYAWAWLLWCITSLASIEVIAHGKIPTREVIQQALLVNPVFFKAVYTDLLDVPKTEQSVGEALSLVRGYLDRRPEIFGPILDYLRDARGPRTATEISHYFEQNFGLSEIALVCEWLADEGQIVRIALPARLTPKSTVTVEEAAFLCE